MNKIVFYMGPSSYGKDIFFAKTLFLYEIQKITPLTTVIMPRCVGDS